MRLFDRLPRCAQRRLAYLLLAFDARHPQLEGFVQRFFARELLR